MGGNQKAREFLDSQSDYDDTMPIQQKYNTKAAALYRDKISTLAQGKEWNIESSSAQDYFGSFVSSSSSSTQKHSSSSKTNSSNGQRSSIESSKSYQDFSDNNAGGGYQNFNSQDFNDQKQSFFNRIQEENASRPEYGSIILNYFFSLFK